MILLFQGPLSPHSTLHASGMQGALLPAALEVLQPAGGIIGLEGVSLLPSEQQLAVQQFASPSLQSMQPPLTAVVQPVTVLTTSGQNPSAGATLLQQVNETDCNNSKVQLLFQIPYLHAYKLHPILAF